MSDPIAVAITQNGHVWEPLMGYYGRYRCKSHGCIGYRGLVTATDGDGAPGEQQTAWQSKTVKRAFNIFPYVCKHKDCGASATGWGKRQFCGMHQKV